MVWGGNPGTGNDVGGAVLADVNGDGCPDTTVAMATGQALVFYNDCSGNFPFSPSLSYGMGDPAIGLAVADVNGDGHPDIITGGIPLIPDFGTYAGDSVTVRLNDGTGKFGPAHVYRGDPGMFALVVADLKGTGYPEILTANQNANSMTVYESDGTGGFGEPMGGYDGFIEGVPTSPINAPLTADLVADVDGDGKPDLTLMEKQELGSYNDMETLTVLLNEGNGQFSPPIRSPLVEGGAFVLDYVLADFRKTGRPDFVSLVLDHIDGLPTSQLIYAPSIGNGQFGPPVAIPFPSSDQYAFGSLAVGDFNNDGKLDLALATPFNTGTNDELVVYLGNGDGTFKPPSQLVFGKGADVQAVYIGDANRDGKQDVFIWFRARGGTSAALSECLGNGDGTFKAAQQTLTTVELLTMADLNHDGLLDIVDIESNGTNGLPGETSPTVNVYLGQANGGFSAPVTYAPYPGLFAWVPGIGGEDVIEHGFGPYLGDFDGDGNLDLAIYQQGIVYAGPSYVQFMKGNGDGTFEPTFDLFQFGTRIAPELGAYNLLGDGRSVLAQTPSFPSSYHVLPSAPAPGFQIEMAAIPVVGGKDAIELFLNVPSASNTIVTLSASNPTVQVPASVTIPAGQLSLEVPFTLGGNYPANHWFTVTAQGAGSTATAYNFPLLAQMQSPFTLSIVGGFVAPLGGNFSTPAPGESSVWAANITSNGVGTSAFQVSCSGLPATASCTDFAPENFTVEPGATNGDTFTINTDATIKPGTYPFTVTVTDGFTSITASAVLRIGDFSLSLSPSSLTVPPTGTVDLTLNLISSFGYGEPVTASCSNLPSGGNCPTQGQPLEYGSEPFAIILATAPPGTYNVTVTGTSPSLVRSATAQLQIPAAPFASLDQTALFFVPTLVGATGISQTTTLTNNGNAALNFTSIAASAASNGAFAQTNTCGASLAVNQSCTISVTFTPSVVGTVLGSLTLTDNALDSPQVISLSGAGDDFEFEAAAGGSTTATVSAGNAATYDLQIQGNQFQGNINLSCSDTPSHATCRGPQSVFLNGAAPLPLEIQISTITYADVAPVGFAGRADLRGRAISLAALALVFACLATLLRFPKRNLARLALGFLVVLCALTIMSSCGGGGGYGGGGGGGTTSPGTYTITLTGQTDAGSRSINLTLIVQ